MFTTKFARNGSMASDGPHAGKRSRFDDQEEQFSPHLQLGISWQGIVEFLRQLQFYDMFSPDEQTPSSLYGRYYSEYTRPDELSWVTETVSGPFNAHANPFRGEQHNATGYDLCWVIRQWLRSRGQDHLSVNEVLKAEGSPHVGEANIFWSHIQQKGVDHTLRCMQNAVRDHASELPTEPFFWLDYFALRQCQRDFDPASIRRLIQKQPAFVAEVDGSLLYFQRSFCLFEVWAAAEGQCKLLADTYPQTGRQLTGGHKIDSAAATSRDPADKVEIDEMIKATIGFAPLDALLTETVLACHRRQFGNATFACLRCGSLEHQKDDKWPDGTAVCTYVGPEPPEASITGGHKGFHASTGTEAGHGAGAATAAAAAPKGGGEDGAAQHGATPSDLRLVPDEQALELNPRLTVHADCTWCSTFVDFGGNNNKYYRGQVLVDAGGGNGSEYFSWSRWGRVGERGQSRMEGPYEAAEGAVTSFEKKFKDKTGHVWKGLAADYPQSRPGKYSVMMGGGIV